jgi:putative hydrolase of the HAD superfamily
MMVGNSLKSDIVPAIEVGSWGIFIPHPLTWALEHVDAPKDAPRFRQIERIAELSTLLAEIER